MTSLLPSAKSLVPVLTIALLLAVGADAAYAQSSAAPNGLRGMSTVPSGSALSSALTGSSSGSSGTSGSSSGASSTPGIPAGPAGTSSSGAGGSGAYPGSTGCIDTVQSSMANASNYTYAQNVAVHTNIVQQPVGFSSCLDGLLKQFQTLSNMFSNGFSFSVAINSFASSAIDTVINDLEKQACTDLTKAASGIFGTVTKDLSALTTGGIVISLDTPVGTLPTPKMPSSTPPTGGTGSSSSSGSKTTSSSSGTVSSSSSSSGTRTSSSSSGTRFPTSSSGARPPFGGPPSRFGN